jgi:hypothetical protein
MPTESPNDAAKAANGKNSLERFHDVIRTLETERDSKIWCMVHQGRRSHICYPAMRALYSGRAITGRGRRLEILLHTGGGHPEIAYSVMKFFRRRFKEVNVIVPLIAKKRRYSNVPWSGPDLHG